MPGGRGIEQHPIDADRIGDVLQPLLAEVAKADVELVHGVVEGRAGDTDPAGLGNGLQPRGDVDAVAVKVVALDDDVAEIDADAELDALGWRKSLLRSAMPRWTVAAQRRASTTLANSTSAPSPISLTMRPWHASIAGSISSRRRLEPRERARLVLAHEAAVADDVGGQDRRHPPFAVDRMRNGNAPSG